MNLKLNKPLIVFDLETTGTNVASDRIVEISLLKIMPDGSRVIKTQKINPTIPIPERTSQIHGIYDKDVAECPTFKEFSGQLFKFIEHCDLAGYNCIRFDVPLLVEEFLRCEIDIDITSRKIVDVQNIFHQMEQRTLSAAYKFYCQKDLINAHSAEADVAATTEVLLAQIERYKDTELTDAKGKKFTPVKNEVNALHDFTNSGKFADLAGRIAFNEKGEEVFNFGKHNGKSVVEVLKAEPSYYAWMLNGDFPLYTKKILTGIKLREFNKK